MKITALTDFSNFSINAGTATRDSAQEGLIVKTAASVTGSSTVVLDADAGKYLQGIDLRAGTTGDSTIDASADDATPGFLLAGGLGRNTIKGGEGSDAIIGANENDSLVGDKGDDRITTGKGDDTVDGGSGDDLIVMGDNFDPAFDVIKGGTGADTLSFTFQEGNTESILDGLTDIEGIELGAANTSITLKEVLTGDDKSDTVAASTTFKVAFAKDTTTETLTFDGSAETNGKVSVTGAAGDDDITGGEGIDTLVGGAGADALDGGDGTTATTDVFKYVTTTAGVLVAGGDTITGFVTGQDQLEFGQAAIAADGLLPAVAELLLSNDADYVAPTDVSAFDSASGEKFLFQAGTAATLDGATFLYDAATGALAYDKDGTAGGADSAEAVAVANLGAGTVLAQTDLVVA